MEDIRTAAKIKVDYLAVSFPKSSADMVMARQLLRAAGGEAFLIAKIERAEAVEPKALIDIMSACEGSWWRAGIWRSRSGMPRSRRCKNE